MTHGEGGEEEIEGMLEFWRGAEIDGTIFHRTVVILYAIDGQLTRRSKTQEERKQL